MRNSKLQLTWEGAPLGKANQNIGMQLADRWHVRLVYDWNCGNPKTKPLL